MESGHDAFAPMDAMFHSNRCKSKMDLATFFVRGKTNVMILLGYSSTV